MTMLPFGQVAPVSRRAIAYVIDALIVTAIAIVLAVLLVVIVLPLGGDPMAMLAALAIGYLVIGLLMAGWAVVYTIMQTGKGSIGMRAQGLRLADAGTGQSIGFWRALLRNIVFSLAGSIVVGYFSPLFDGSGRFQGWHDKAARAVILDARTSPRPSSAPATSAVPTPGRPASGAPAIPPGFPAPPAAPVVPPVPPVPGGTPGAPQPPVGMPPVPPQPASGFSAPPAPSNAPGFSAPSASPGFGTPSAAPAPQTPAPPVPPVPPLPRNAQPNLDETIVARPPAPPAPEGDELIAFVPGITQDAPVRRDPAPEPEPTPEPAAAPEPEAPAAAPGPEAPAAAGPDDEEDIEQTRISVPGHRLVFTWDDGTRVSVSRRTIFGRNPENEEAAVAVPVRDDTLSLSKTHFEAAAEAMGGWILDRGSTNGTTIVRDGVRIACPAGQRVPVKLGDVIAIGDRVVTVGGYE